MTRKDFELIAEVLNEGYDKAHPGGSETKAVFGLAQAFAKRLAETNERFDYDRFMSAVLHEAP